LPGPPQVRLEGNGKKRQTNTTKEMGNKKKVGDKGAQWRDTREKGPG